MRTAFALALALACSASRPDARAIELARNGVIWLHGDYSVTITARNAAEQTFAYTGTVPVPFTKPPTPALPGATMPNEVTGSRSPRRVPRRGRILDLPLPPRERPG